MTDFLPTTGRILILDDEPLVTDTLKALLELESPWEIAAFTRPEKALEEIVAREAQVVVSDYLMPGMDGLEFLKQVKELRPFASRLLLTGYADKENAIRFINEVGLFQYIEKPWDNSQLLVSVRNAMERTHLLTLLDARMREAVERDRSLESLRAGILKAIL